MADIFKYGDWSEANGAGTYQASVACMNCNFSGSLVIRRGVRVSEMKCPTCGCDKLIPAVKASWRVDKELSE